MEDFRFSSDFVRDVLNGKDPPPPARPNDPFYAVLEQMLVTYYNVYRWCAFPLRVEVGEDGKKRLLIAESWKQMVPQLDHAMYSLRLFQKRTGKAPTALGIRTGKVSNLLVLDLDQPLDDAYKFIRANKIALSSDDFCVITRSKGHQFYYAWHNSLNDSVTTSAKFFGKDSPVDIRGDGGFVIAPGSRVLLPGGGCQQYVLDGKMSQEKRREAATHPIPGKLLSMLQERKRVHADVCKANADSCTKALADIDKESHDKIMVAHDAACDSPKGERSGTLFSLVCRCVEAGLREDEIRSVCADIPKVVEKTSAGIDHLQYVIRGALSVVGAPEPEQITVDMDLSDPYDRVMSSVESLDPKQQYEWLVDRFLAVGQVSIFFGPEGLGKSVLVLDMIRDLMDGKPALGGLIEGTRDRFGCMYLEGDKGDTALKGIYLPRIFYPPDPSRQLFAGSLQEMEIDTGLSFRLGKRDGHGWNLLDRLLAKHHPDFLILDSLTSCLDIDFNSTDEAAYVMSRLHKIAGKYRCHVILIAHPRKDGKLRAGEVPNPTLDDLAGSRAFKGLADVICGVYRAYGESGERIHHAGTLIVEKDGATIPPFRQAKWRMVDTAENVTIAFGETLEDGYTPALDDLKRQLLSCIARYTGSWVPGSKVVAINAKASRPSRYRALSMLVEDGYVKARGGQTHKYYILTARGAEEVAAMERESQNRTIDEEDRLQQIRYRAILRALIEPQDDGTVLPLVLREETIVQFIADMMSGNEDVLLSLYHLPQDLEELVDKGHLRVDGDEDVPMYGLTDRGKILCQEIFHELFDEDE